MATVNKDFRVKHGLVVEGSNATVNGSNVLTEASTEFLQDTIGAMVNGSTQTNITVTYDDDNGKLNFAAENGVADSTTTDLAEGTNKYFTDERAQDAVGNAVGTGLAYDDASGAISTSNIPNSSLQNSAITINGTSTSLGGTRTLNTDDIAESGSPTNKWFTDERAQDAIATAISNGTQTNISVTYNDNDNSLSFNASGGVSSITGTAAEVEVSASTGAITIGLPNDVTVSGYLTLSNEPAQANHAATKAYVDASTAGLNVHDSVKAATTANINITTDLENGDLIDGVTLATGNRILVKNQSTKSQNGVYIVQAFGAATRALDYDSVGEVDAGDFIFVENGTVNGKTGWVQTETITTLGSDNIEFTQFSGAGTYLAGNGLNLTGEVFSINTGVTADLTTIQTLTNKTLTSPTITNPSVSGLYLSDNNIVIEGTVDTYETTLTFTNPTDDRTITFKDESGTVAYTADVDSAVDGFGNSVTGGTGLGVSYNSTTNALSLSNTGVTSVAGTTNQISASASTGAVTLSLPQNIHTSATPTFSGLNVGSVTLTDALIGTATQALTDALATVVDSWAVASYSSAKYIVQMKKGSDIEVIEVLVTVDGNNNVYLTEYADVISNVQLGTTDAGYDNGNVNLTVTASNGTTVKVHKTLIEA